MLMLRLQRVGRRNEAHFKIVVIEKSKGAKSHKYVDIVGSYNPKLGTVQIDAEKVTKHLANGVQPSDTVRNMLITKGIIEGKKVNVLPRKSPVVNEEKIAREKEEAEAKLAKAAEEKVSAEEAKKAEETAAEASELESKEEKTPTEEVTEESKEEVDTAETEELKEEVVVEEKKEDE